MQVSGMDREEGGSRRERIGVVATGWEKWVGFSATA
jgi:hypothetical protein